MQLNVKLGTPRWSCYVVSNATDQLVTVSDFPITVWCVQIVVTNFCTASAWVQEGCLFLSNTLDHVAG
jgi:hypothetical protein